MEYGEELENYILKIAVHEKSQNEINVIKQKINLLKSYEEQRDKLALTYDELTDIHETLIRYDEMVVELTELRDMPKKFITVLYN